MDDKYVRNGVASIFTEVEPLGGKRQVKITDRRTRTDWAHFITWDTEISERIACYDRGELKSRPASDVFASQYHVIFVISQRPSQNDPNQPVPVFFSLDGDK